MTSGGTEDIVSTQSLIANQRTRGIRRVLVTILMLNVAVAVAKLVYGLLTNSLSMTADGLNSMMDGASNVIGLIGVSVASRPPDPNHPYGHQRFETLSSLVIAVFLILAVERILTSAWDRWQSGATPEVTAISFAVLLGTLIVNIVVATWERRAGRRLKSPFLIADSRHTLSDVFVTISVIGGLVAVRLGYPIADLILAVVVAGFIAWGAWTVIEEAVMRLSDVAVVPAPEIEQAARSIPGVEGIHNVRTRGGDGLTWVDLHIQVDRRLSVAEAHEIASRVASQVEQAIGEPADVTVHIEPADPSHLQPHRGFHPGG